MPLIVLFPSTRQALENKVYIVEHIRYFHASYGPMSLYTVNSRKQGLHSGTYKVFQSLSWPSVPQQGKLSTFSEAVAPSVVLRESNGALCRIYQLEKYVDQLRTSIQRGITTRSMALYSIPIYPLPTGSSSYPFSSMILPTLFLRYLSSFQLFVEVRPGVWSLRWRVIMYVRF